MVYINSHIRHLEAYQKIKQHNLPTNIIFNTHTNENYVGKPPGIYWPILQSILLIYDDDKHDEICRSIDPWFIIIRGDRVREVGVIKEPTIYQPITLHRGWEDIPSIDHELEAYVKTKDRPSVKVNCII